MEEFIKKGNGEAVADVVNPSSLLQGVLDGAGFLFECL
jgi:formiminotetrahydrofolate cyclodeaminase